MVETSVSFIARNVLKTYIACLKMTGMKGLKHLNKADVIYSDKISILRNEHEKIRHEKLYDCLQWIW